MRKAPSQSLASTTSSRSVVFMPAGKFQVVTWNEEVTDLSSDSGGDIFLSSF